MAEQNSHWPALKNLLALPSDKQRDLLRLHKEKGFSDENQREIDDREALDQELIRLCKDEFQRLCNPAAPVPHPKDIAEFVDSLTRPAFVQYLNSYLYFLVRFAAGRIHNPCACHKIDPSNCNETTTALPPPPMCQDGWNNQGVVEEFLNLTQRDKTAKPLEDIALRFLDGFTQSTTEKEATNSVDSEETRLELWFRRLYFAEPQQSYFEQLEQGLSAWAQNRYNFYTSLETKSAAKSQWVYKWKNNSWKEGQWVVNNPIAARCALLDFYWLAKLLRADVSEKGEVSYSDHSWLSLLATWHATDPRKDKAQRAAARAEILRQEEVLRAAFGYACDLVQNAVEIADDCEDWNAAPDQYAVPPPAAVLNKKQKAALANNPSPPKAWREVEDHEQLEIQIQRKERQYKSTPGSNQGTHAPCPESEKPAGWSRRVWTGEQVDNLFGVAFSGGGIRSATFNLGVLQRLHELDLLRQVDYLSTVSGGGYVGAWLIGNVRRTRYWLSRMTSWDLSVEHLRRYSDYLAPHNGLLSADTWTIGLTWIRNALLIQVTSFIWLAFLVMLVLNAKLVFEWARDGFHSHSSAPHMLLLGSMAVIAAILGFFLSQEKAPHHRLGHWIFQQGNRFMVSTAALAWLGCFLTGGLLWGQVADNPSTFTTFSGTLKATFLGWSRWVPLLFALSIALMAWQTIRKSKSQSMFDRTHAWFFAVLLVPAVAYLAICAQLRLFGALLSSTSPSDILFHLNFHQEWLAFVIGPSISMLAIALALVVFIGLLGKTAPDWTRELWTRYGALIAMIGAISLIALAATVIAPWALLQVGHLNWKAGTGAATWLASVISGLLAGKSSKTGEGGKRSNALEIVARVGGFLFIAGAVAGGSTIVYLILREALTNDSVSYTQNLQTIIYSPSMRIIPIATAILGWLLSSRFDLNTFGLNQFYRNRLVRCYLGATRWQPGKRHEHPFTGFDQEDDLDLADLRTKDPDPTFCGESFRGPFPIINCTLNLGGSSDLTVHTRQSASFALTPIFAGADRNKVGYTSISPSAKNLYAGGITLGQAISVSGAAASPNMGYSTSPLVSFMMTLFNVRLGWWFPNPSKCRHNNNFSSSAKYLLSELLGLADETSGFINISDGGHFENLGVYELIRRKTRVIVAADAECDPNLNFGALGNLVRICQTDFGARINLDISSIRKQAGKQHCRNHCAVGKIIYSNGTIGYIIYIKSSITGDEDIGIAQYQSDHPTFPHETTGDQFYSEDQFEAYRRLGHHIASRTFRDAESEPTPVEVATKLFDVWAPAGFTTDSFLQHADNLVELMDRFRMDTKLHDLFSELTGGPTANTPLAQHERAACLEALQLMENVFLDLRLDDFWDHPDNRGWIMLFSGFARSKKFRDSWDQNRTTYGIRFEYFCSQRLGLTRDRPVVRV